jgi:nitrate/nitrite transport system substrate-binding protein
MNTFPRRKFLRLATAAPAGLIAGKALAACASGGPSGDSGPAAAAASGEPIKLGFIALTDCSSLVMAQELGYFEERGLNVEVIKQASWPATRDNLLSGQVHGAHCLFSMPTSLAAGIGGKPEQVLKIAMILNNNGQAITLERSLAAAGYGDLEKATSALAAKRDLTLAMTFPGGTHDTWLRYWLKAAKVTNANIIPIPPPQMVANMKVGTMGGFCVGEPWGAQAAREGIGFTALNTQDIWQHHPEKALVVNPAFAKSRRDDLKALMGAVLKASKWLDDPANRAKAAQTVGTPAFVGAAPNDIEGRMLGKYDLGLELGTKTYGDDYMRFYRDGLVNAPRRAHVVWQLAQYQRLGLLKEAPPYMEIADRLVLKDLYQEAAEAEGVPVPDDDMAPFEVKLDNVRFDPAKPDEEVKRP